MRPFVPCRFARSPSPSPSFLFSLCLLRFTQFPCCSTFKKRHTKPPRKKPKKKTEKTSLVERFIDLLFVKFLLLFVAFQHKIHSLVSRIVSSFLLFTRAPVLSSVSHRILSFLLSTTYCIKFSLSLSLSLSLSVFLSVSVFFFVINLRTCWAEISNVLLLLLLMRCRCLTVVRLPRYRCLDHC